MSQDWEKSAQGRIHFRMGSLLLLKSAPKLAALQLIGADSDLV